MPARQDQTLQIFLIVFIFGFLVSAVVAYLGWKGYSDAEQRLATSETSLNEERGRTQTLQSEIEGQRQMMGFAPDDNPTEVKAAFVEDMTAMGGGVVDMQQVGESPDWEKVINGGGSYRKVLETVHTEAQRTAQREASLNDQLKDLTSRMQAVEAAKEQQVVQHAAGLQKAAEDLASERNKFNQDRATLEQRQQELMQIVEKQKTDFEAQLAKHVAENQEQTETIVELKQSVQNLVEQRKDEPGSFEIADGRISWVNQDGTVWINLGTADSLRRQVTFAVYDADQHDAAKAEKKGAIEVTRIIGDHMAEARVTEDDPTNPILTGDHIYSQVWHRGKKLRFALTGIIDIDGDEQSDMDLARELIELNGGVVDAYVNEQGEVVGDITANTRYLVLGDFPEAATQVALQKPWEDMHQESRGVGVETITLPEFLNQMGYRPQDRSVRLGSGATARDFPARPENGSSRPGAATLFRSRTPNRSQPASTQ